MNIVGQRTLNHDKGFSEDLNKFLQLGNLLRKRERITPRGVFYFKTFKEADEWRHKVLTGQNPGRPQ